MKDMLSETTPTILINIRAKLPLLNPAQKGIANYILHHFSQMEGMQSSVLAKNSGVSEATVSRFVKMLGYDSYRAFQVDIAKANTAAGSSEHGYSDVSEADDIATICNKIYATNIQTLKDTLSILDYQGLEQAAGYIKAAKRIHIFAQGRSVVTASSIRQRFTRLGICCTIYSDPHEQAVVSSLMNKEDLVIGISTFGRSAAVVKSLKRARENGSPVIGITSYQNVPIEKYADVILRAVDNETVSFGVEPSCATVSQMIMLDCLYIIVTMKMKEQARQCFEKTFSALEEEKL